MWARGGGTGAAGGRKGGDSVAAKAPGQCPAEGVMHSPEDTPAQPGSPRETRLSVPRLRVLGLC